MHQRSCQSNFSAGSLVTLCGRIVSQKFQPHVLTTPHRAYQPQLRPTSHGHASHTDHISHFVHRPSISSVVARLRTTRHAVGTKCHISQLVQLVVNWFNCISGNIGLPTSCGRTCCDPNIGGQGLPVVDPPCQKLTEQTTLSTTLERLLSVEV